jgi:hypothetical protein
MRVCQREGREREREREDKMDGVTLYCGEKRRKEGGFDLLCVCFFLLFPVCVGTTRRGGKTKTSKREEDNFNQKEKGTLHSSSSTA